MFKLKHCSAKVLNINKNQFYKFGKASFFLNFLLLYDNIEDKSTWELKLASLVQTYFMYACKLGPNI